MQATRCLLTASTHEPASRWTRIENLEGGAPLDQFLAWFPGVARAQAEAVLEHAARSLQAA